MQQVVIPNGRFVRDVTGLFSRTRVQLFDTKHSTNKSHSYGWDMTVLSTLCDTVNLTMQSHIEHPDLVTAAHPHWQDTTGIQVRDRDKENNRIVNLEPISELL